MTSQSRDSPTESLITLDLATYESWQQELATLRRDNEQLQRDLAAYNQSHQAVIQQISETLEAQFVERTIELVEKVAELQAILDYSPALIYVKDTQGRFLLINHQLEILLRLTREQVQGKSNHEVFSQEVADAFWQHDQQVLKAGTALRFEEVALQDDELHTYLSVKFPLFNAEGTAYAVCGISTDISDRKRADEDRFRLAAIIESSDDAIISKTLDGMIISWNAGAERIFGYKAEEVIGQPVALLVPEDRLDEEPQILKRLKRGERLEHFETIRKRKDGTLINLSLTISPVKDVNGNVIGASKIARDISDRWRVEEVLRQKEAQYRSIFEAVTDGISIMDLQTGMLVAANPALCQMHGYSLTEFKQLQPADFIHPDSLPLFETYLETIRAGHQFHCQAIDLRQDGTPFDVEVTGTVCIYDGKPHALSIVRNTSDRKQAERQMQESQQLLQLVLNTIPHKVFWKDCNLIYRGCNRAFAKDSGSTPTEIVGKSDYDLPWTTADSDWYRECDQRVMESDSPELGIIETLLQANGTQVWIETSKLPLHNIKGAVIGVLGIYQDITERKQAEAQLNQRTEELENTLQELQRTQMQMIQSEKMSSLGQLVAGVAHEINNPVNFISGNLNHADAYTQEVLGLLQLYQQHYPAPHPDIQQEAESIDLEFLTEDLPKLLTSMKVGADRIQAIVASLRNFSRMDEAEMKEVNIHDGIDSTLMILQHRLKAKHDFPEIKVVKAYGALPLIECYPGQLNQVFMNILSNAIDALEESWVTDNGSLVKEHRANTKEQSTAPTIWMRTEVVDAQQMRIIFSDNGTGMTAAVRERLFDPFFTTKAVGKGTGMGMSISYQIITEKHQGSLQCVSLPGQGTEFVIEIPLRQQA